MANPKSYSAEYYISNEQHGDRIALWFYERVAKRLISPGSRALDYGAGTGFFAKRLSRHFDTDAFDPSQNARDLISVNAPDVRVWKESASIPADSYDLVTSLHVLEHIERPLSAIAEITRLLRPGGRTMCVVPDPEGWGHRIKQEEWFAFSDPTHVSLLTMEEWQNLFERSGLHIDRVSTGGLWDVPYVPRIPRFLQMPTFGGLAGVQVLAGRAFLPVHWGECLVLFASKQ